MRRPYKNKNSTFDIENVLKKDPFDIFCNWFSEACEDENVIEPNAMALATSSKQGIPTVRMVLLKGYDDKGFTFFTNYKSRKGTDLESNPEAHLLFYWPSLHRQIRIGGSVSKLSEIESAEYFKFRPRASQISCYVSEQSQPVSGKNELEERRMHAEQLFENKEVEKPEFWGGYILTPRNFEFWQGQTDRFHDRVYFRKLLQDEDASNNCIKKAENGWVYEILCP
ncbi:hypothetical protein HELRODRAFT_73175 [Helobdella robusta]|uniref:pyridoxal 5'-phosphate synthase n=1 Tax=Helobdella robusta TaxID=6412 RepID=T1G1B2_HELRO|nr:hypothetical protein HELRODRAFT_73175 [Helobdella robusta]ESO09915.1 hypothetical protein HELRODRAFT_73175 [Helobdella robusta]